MSGTAAWVEGLPWSAIYVVFICASLGLAWVSPEWWVKGGNVLVALVLAAGLAARIRE